MYLRYKGKPRQVDKLEPLCFCRFVAVGFPLDGRQCSIHGTNVFGCDRCITCHDYRPREVKKYPADWPICICGHIAQDHNQIGLRSVA